jgi:transketolase
MIEKNEGDNMLHHEMLKNKVNQARAAIVTMTTLAQSGHPGGSMSTIDFLLTLLHMIKTDPQNPKWEERDRIVFSHGHVSPAAYSAFALRGFFPLEDAISQFRLAGSIFEGHVEPDVPGIEWASGNLGQGLSAACGFALACRQKGMNNHIYVLMGDGEQQKGQLSEARRFAVKYKMNNIIGFIDYNKLQISGRIETVMPQNIKDTWLADGWNVIEIDGHSFSEIENSILQAQKNEKPTVILAKTVMGNGVSFMENKEKYHGSPLSEADLEKALLELHIENKINEYKELRKAFQPKNHNHETTASFHFNTGKNRQYDSTADNRSAWGNAIADIAKNLNSENKYKLAVFDNDLQASVKTADYEKTLPAQFYQSGIMEHHTATMAGAMSKEGIQVFFPGFGVFGVDETYNQHRLNDINRANLKIVTTHIGLDVGEDGKTHQCIDYVGLIRNLFHFKIIVPADANQTDHVIRYVVNQSGNYLIAMGRSKYEPVRLENSALFYNEKYQFEYGKADKLRSGSDAALLVMGTMCSRSIEVYNLLKKDLSVAVWHVACPTALSDEMLKEAARTGYIFTYEDHHVRTGLGNCVAERLAELQIPCKLKKFGVEDYAFSGSSEDVFRYSGLDSESIARKILREIR